MRWTEILLLRFFRIKNRPYFNPLIAHIGKIEQLKSLCSNIPKEAQELIDAFWPGPLTLVLPKKKKIGSRYIDFWIKQSSSSNALASNDPRAFKVN
jgi:L-threonylcarbamoyladenylate synthase